MSSAPSPLASAPALAMAALLIGAVCTGFAPIFVKLSETDALATAIWRCWLAVPMVALLARHQHGRTADDKRQQLPSGWRDWAALCLPGLLFAGDLGTWHHSILITTAANASLLANCQTIFVSLFVWLVWKENLGAKFVAGLVLAACGTVILMWDSLSIEVSGEVSRLYGDLLSVVTAMFYAAYILSVARLRRRYSAALIIGVSAVVTGAVLLPISLLTEATLIPETWQGWAVLFGVALVAHVGGQNLIAQALSELPAAFSSVALLVAPVACAIAGWLILGESLSPLALLGGGITLCGILLARLASIGTGVSTGMPRPKKG